MSLPPPKFRKLNEEFSTGADVWDISVPPKNSLYWSIVMSYMLLADDQKHFRLLNQLTGSEEEIQIEKNLNFEDINTLRISKEWKKCFNPFKNRRNAFHAKNMTDVCRIFTVRLDQFSSKIHSKPYCNYDLKLKAACKMLNCNIEVYFPDEPKHAKSVYSTSNEESSIKSTIILLQYRNQELKAKQKKIDVFHFAMKVEYAHSLKLKAMEYWLKRAKISKHVIEDVKKLMKNAELHGENFLPTILQKGSIDIIPYIYKSPYIAVKLSKAGFETNPRDTSAEMPSAFCYALRNADTKYIRILYDYTCNCRHLLGKTVRNADDTVLETLQELQSILKSDISKIRNCNFDKKIENGVLVRLEYFLRFAECQHKIASETQILKKQLKKKKYTKIHEIPSSEKKKEMHEKVILSCLNNYLKFFHYKTENNVCISERFNNFLKFSEFYENIDNFAFVYFFDNIFSLKLFSMGIQEENKFLNIEWKILLSMMSGKYFSKFDYSDEFLNKDSGSSLRFLGSAFMGAIFEFVQYISRMFSTEECFKMYLEYGRDRDILQSVPFFCRNSLEDEINNFIKELKCKNFKFLSKDINPMPEILDELLIIRLKKYIDAALSPQDHSMEVVLAIERALQVIGESIKAPSSSGSVVSYLLSACLSKSLWKELTDTRNTLSNYRSNSVYGRLELEKDKVFFNDVRRELKILWKSFDVVAFTQKLRVEETLMLSCRQELEKHGLSENTIQVFEKECELRRDIRRIEYKEYHRQCKMLFVDMVTDLQESLKDTSPNIGRQLKAVAYLISFIRNHGGEEEYYILLRDFKGFTAKYSAPLSQEASNEMQLYLDHLLLEYQNRSTDSPKEVISKSTPGLQQLIKRIKLKQFNEKEKECIQTAIKNAYEESTEAKNEIKDKMFNSDFTQEKREILLKRLMMDDSRINEIRESFKSMNLNLALKYLQKKYPSKEGVENDVRKMLEDDSNIKGYPQLLLLKIAFQSKLKENIYDNASLSKKLANKLIHFLMKKSDILNNRLKALTKILIYDDDEIKYNWKWGRRAAIKCHTRFLMRERYMRQMTVQASLEMGFFDCLVVLNRNDLNHLFQKSSNLFSGANLRNIIAHRCSVPEKIGEILDEDDFPSAIIDKILKLIKDSKAIESMTELFKISGIFEKESFESFVENYLENNNHRQKYLIKTIKKCKIWKRYLSLLPFP